MFSVEFERILKEGGDVSEVLRKAGVWGEVFEDILGWCMVAKEGEGRVVAKRVGKVVDECLSDVGVFAHLFFPHHLKQGSAPFHRELYELVRELSSYKAEGTTMRKLAVAAPRGHAKSTLISMIYVCWLVCFKIRDFVLLISDSEDQAAMLLDAVKSEFEGNEKLRGVFGDLVGSVWGAYGIETKNGVKVMCRGAGQKIRGLKYKESRPGVVIVDDVESDVGVETEDSRIKLKRWFYGAVLPCGGPDCVFMVIGTLLHEDSLLANLLEAKGWVSKRYDAEEGENGDTLWPTRFTRERLNEIKEEYASQNQVHVYFREYRNLFIDTENATFQRKFFIHWTEKEWDEYALKTITRTFLTVDPAYTRTGKSDFTAFVVASTDHQNKLYVRKVVKERLSLTDLMRLWIKLHLAYRPTYHGAQNIDWTKSLETPLREEQRRCGVFFPVRVLPTYAKTIGMYNKEARIEQLAPRYATGNIIHVGPQTELEEQLLSFPRGKNDDIPDALAMCSMLAFPAPSRKEIKKNWESYEDPISRY